MDPNANLKAIFDIIGRNIWRIDKRLPPPNHDFDDLIDRAVGPHDTCNLLEPETMDKGCNCPRGTAIETVRGMLDDLNELTNLLPALDEWIRKGGTLPDFWLRGQLKTAASPAVPAGLTGSLRAELTNYLLDKWRRLPAESRTLLGLDKPEPHNHAEWSLKSLWTIQWMTAKLNAADRPPDSGTENWPAPVIVVHPYRAAGHTFYVGLVSVMLENGLFLNNGSGYRGQSPKEVVDGVINGTIKKWGYKGDVVVICPHGTRTIKTIE